MLRIISYALLCIFLIGFVANAVLLFFPKLLVSSLTSNLLLVCLTGAYVVLTHLILESNNELKEIANRPYVVFSLPQKQSSVWLKIENIGKTPAYELSIELNPKLDTFQFDGMDNSRLLNQSYLRPNEVITHPVGSISELIKKSDTESVFKVQLKYINRKGKQFEKSYKIDTNNYIFGKKAIKFNSVWIAN